MTMNSDQLNNNSNPNLDGELQILAEKNKKLEAQQKELLSQKTSNLEILKKMQDILNNYKEVEYKKLDSKTLINELLSPTGNEDTFEVQDSSRFDGIKTTYSGVVEEN
jgi:hypothetical protein